MLDMFRNVESVKSVCQVMHIRRAALWLLLALVVVRSAGSIYHSLYLNMAHIALARWAFAPEQAEPEQHLTAAVQWGEKAGPAWMDQHGHSERALALWTHVISETSLARRRAERVYRQGQALEREGQLEAALAAYRQAYAGDGLWVEAGYRTYYLAMQTDQPALAQRHAQALRVQSPEYPVNTTLDNGARLLGYDLDEMRLERDIDPIPITLYWELPTPLEDVSQWQADGWTYVGVQDRLYQVGVMDNLLPNGGFERDLSTMAIIPSGYQHVQASLVRDRPDYLAYLQDRHKLMPDRRDRDINQVAVVMNVVKGLNGLTTPHKVAVEPGALYIVGGWMRVTGGGSGFLGGVWGDDSNADLLYWYATQKQPAQSWQHFASASIAPKEATVFTPLALNTGENKVYFDDLVFFQVPFP